MSQPPAGVRDFLGRLLGSRSLALAMFAGLALAPASGAAGPLETAITDQGEFVGAEADLAFARVRATGSSFIRLDVRWPGIVTRRPARPTDPADPAYRWDVLDRKVRFALSHNLRPIMQIRDAPTWAQGKPSATVRPDPVDARYRGPFRPSPADFGRFARAAATRYSGSFGGLPRVRHWQAWNEPNITSELMPQYVGGKLASPAWYRSLLNAFAANVHAVHRDNVVLAAGLSPFTVRNKLVVAVGPLRFMRGVLCVSKGSKPKSTCPQRAQLDVWATHPYTSGGPTRHAFNEDDVSLGDLPDMQRVLAAAVRARKIVSRQKVRFWVTEFSWDTKPPDPHARAVPIKLHGRWVAEALYRMWNAGVSLVAWLQLRDDPYPSFPTQSGLYFRGGASLTRDRPKPAFVAFRFPFVAFKERSAISVWGRTPTSRPGSVVIEETTGRNWRRRVVLRANRSGIFSGRIRATSRARAVPSARLPSQATGYRQAVLADAPSSYWRLGETAGAVARDETGMRNAAYQGGVKLGVGGALLGDGNRAITLDGKDDQVVLGGIGALDTVELWVKTEAIRTNPAFSNRNEHSHFQFLGTVGSGNGFAFDTVSLLGARWVTDGRWHHLVYTYERGGGKLYVDGALDSTGEWSRLVGGTAASLGYDASYRSYFRGSIDEVAVYDHPLTAAQVRRHFQASGQQAQPADRFGIVVKGTYLRARFGSESSLPFSLTRPPDRFVLPFGGGG